MKRTHVNRLQLIHAVFHSYWTFCTFFWTYMSRIQ